MADDDECIDAQPGQATSNGPTQTRPGGDGGIYWLIYWYFEIVSALTPIEWDVHNIVAEAVFLRRFPGRAGRRHTCAHQASQASSGSTGHLAGLLS